MRPALLGSCLLAALAACGRGEAPASSAEAGVRLALGAGERLLAYSFEGAGRVPWPCAEPPEALSFGELGWTPATLLYLGFEDLERELGSGLAGGSLALRAGRAAEGRFGRGVELERGGELALTLAPEDANAPSHTLQFSWKPARLAAGILCEAPGAFTLAVAAGGKLRLELATGGEPLVLVSAEPLEAERWNHIGLVLDRDELRSVRLSVDGVPLGRELAEGVRPAPWSSLALRAGAGAVLDELRLERRAANSAELERHARPVPRPRERLTLEFENGSRTLEPWGSFLTQPVVAGEEAWLRTERTHAALVDGALAWAPADWRALRPLDPPLARTTHPVVTLTGGKLFTFSGETRDSHLGPMKNTRDTWLFDARAERWERVAGEQPPGRCHQPAAYSPEHDLVLMCGGLVNETSEKAVLSDAWVFHVAERRWERKSDAPGELTDAIVVWHAAARRFVVLAGPRAWTYEPSADHWEVLPRPTAADAGGAPARFVPGGSVSSVYEPDSRRIFLFGGQRGTPAEGAFVDDCAWYELEKNRYVRFEPASRPAARVRAAMAHDPRSGCLLLYGGVRDQDSVRFDDLWTLDPRTLEWQPRLAAGAPTRRGGYFGLGHDAECGRFFLLCGRHDRTRFLEEAWSLAFDPAARALVRVPFDRAGWSAGMRWFAEAEGGALEGLRFRSSDDGLLFSPEANEPGPGRFLEARFELAAGSAVRVRALGFR